MYAGKSTDGWLGITDKYWAVDAGADRPSSRSSRAFAYFEDGRPALPVRLPDRPDHGRAGQSQTVETLVFAGAKEVAKINAYEKDLRHHASSTC